jgi:hypothetical protein
MVSPCAGGRALTSGWWTDLKRRGRVRWRTQGSLTTVDEYSICAGNNGQASKGTRWMPWRSQARKGVVSCDKPREAAYRR